MQNAERHVVRAIVETTVNCNFYYIHRSFITFMLLFLLCLTIILTITPIYFQINCIKLHCNFHNNILSVYFIILSVSIIALEERLIPKARVINYALSLSLSLSSGGRMIAFFAFMNGEKETYFFFIHIRPEKERERSLESAGAAHRSVGVAS